MKSLDIAKKLHLPQYSSLDELKEVRNDIIEYARQKCKEQRELCYESHWDMSCKYPEAQFEEDNIRDAIIEAPEPKFE